MFVPLSYINVFDKWLVGYKNNMVLLCAAVILAEKANVCIRV